MTNVKNEEDEDEEAETPAVTSVMTTRESRQPDLSTFTSNISEHILQTHTRPTLQPIPIVSPTTTASKANNNFGSLILIRIQC
jgi:hypothetical protein